MGRAMLSKSVIQFLLMGGAVFPPCYLTCGQTMVDIMKIMVTSFKMSHAHKIRRLLFLRRKVMINLEIIFQNRDISLPTKVRLVKAMVFPVVMYGCESWTVKKAEC